MRPRDREEPIVEREASTEIPEFVLFDILQHAIIDDSDFGDVPELPPSEKEFHTFGKKPRPVYKHDADQDWCGVGHGRGLAEGGGGREGMQQT